MKFEVFLWYKIIQISLCYEVNLAATLTACTACMVEFSNCCLHVFICLEDAKKLTWVWYVYTCRHLSGILMRVTLVYATRMPSAVHMCHILFKSYDLSRTIVLNMFSYLIKYIHYVPKLIPPNISKPFFPECLSSTYLPNTSTTNTPIPFPEGK